MALRTWPQFGEGGAFLVQGDFWLNIS